MAEEPKTGARREEVVDVKEAVWAAIRTVALEMRKTAAQMTGELKEVIAKARTGMVEARDAAKTEVAGAMSPSRFRNAAVADAKSVLAGAMAGAGKAATAITGAAQVAAGMAGAASREAVTQVRRAVAAKTISVPRDVRVKPQTAKTAAKKRAKRKVARRVRK